MKSVIIVVLLVVIGFMGFLLVEKKGGGRMVDVKNDEVIIEDYYGRIIFSPREEDWCGENCVMYPGTRREFTKFNKNDEVFVPEGIDKISEEDDRAVEDFLNEVEKRFEE